MSGFAEAVESIIPLTAVHLCIVHQIRNSRKYIAWKDVKVFMQDLKQIYKARTKDLVEVNLNKLEARWGSVSGRDRLVAA